MNFNNISCLLQNSLPLSYRRWNVLMLELKFWIWLGVPFESYSIMWEYHNLCPGFINSKTLFTECFGKTEIIFLHAWILQNELWLGISSECLPCRSILLKSRINIIVIIIVEYITLLLLLLFFLKKKIIRSLETVNDKYVNTSLLSRLRMKYMFKFVRRW